MLVEIVRDRITASGLDRHLHVRVKGYGYVVWEDELYLAEEFASTVVQHYNAGRLEEHVPRYSGCFAFVIVDDEQGTVCIIHDRWGTYPIYYSRSEERIVLSHEWMPLVTAESEMNERAVLEMCTFGYCLGTKTLLSNIAEFDPHAIIRVGSDDLSIHQTSYWSLGRTAISDKSAADLEADFAALWRQRIRIYTEAVARRSDTCYIPLTSGLDSRLLAHEFAKEDLGIHAMTYGSGHDYPDIRYAREVAAEIGDAISSHHLLFLNKHTIHDVLAGVARTQRITCAHLAGVSLHYPARIAGECAFHIPGHTGDFMASGHVKYKMKWWSSKAEQIAYILRYKSTPLTRHYMQHDARVGEMLSTSLEEVVPSDDDRAVGFMRWNVENRQRRYIIRSAMPADPDMMHLILPYYDYPLFDFFLGLPLKYLFGKKLYVNTQLRYLYADRPELARVRREGERVQVIRSTLVNEYYPKALLVMKQLLGRDRPYGAAIFAGNVPWPELFDDLDLPPCLDRAFLRRTTIEGYLYQNILNLYVISSVFRDLKTLRQARAANAGVE